MQKYTFSCDNALVVSRAEILSAVVCLYFKEVMLILCPMGMLIQVFNQMNTYRANSFQNNCLYIKMFSRLQCSPFTTHLESHRLKCSNYAPGAKNGPAKGVTFYIGLYRENVKKSCLKPLSGFYQTWQMILIWSSLIIVQMAPICCISRSHRLKRFFKIKPLKILSDTTRPSLDICYVASSSGLLQSLFKLCLWAKNGPTLGVTCFA